ncbi:MAG: sigma-70 family RNA polymerase sigma factor, partial [Bacteroidota bacterium]
MFVRSKQTAASFVADVQSGGVKAERAIAQLFQQQGGSIIRFIENRNGNIADAEDVLQEAMTALVLNIRKGSFKGDSAVHTYLFAIAKGIWYKRFNKTVRGREIVDSLEPQEEADYQNAEYDLLESEQT